MDRNNLIIAFLLGVCVALGVALCVQSGNALPAAYAQAASGGEMFAVTGTGTQSQGKDNFFLVDSRATRLAVYEYQNGRLKLGALRNFEYDFRFETFGKQDPTVKQMRKDSEKIDKGK